MWSIGILAAGLPRIARQLLGRMDVLALFPVVALIAISTDWPSLYAATSFALPGLLALQAFAGKPAEIACPEPAQDPVDTLTGLPTRGCLEAVLARAGPPPAGHVSACLVLRLDDADRLVARWGAEGRDQVLRRVTERLRTALRASDCLVRAADGTFGILLEPVRKTRQDGALALAHRLRATVGEPMTVAGVPATVACTMGLATSDTVDHGALLQAAEAALEEAHRLAPGEIVAYSREIGDRSRAETELSRSVDEAFASGAIRPWFQPQISTDTGRITGFEALARWHHPTRGILTPSQFLDAIARAGQLPRLGEVMLTQALSALAAWDRKGLPVPSVSVNFSPEELRDPGLPDRIKWEVDRFDLRPARLTIEILETVAAQGADDVVTRNLVALARHGFHLDLDDFGTGQASIANVHRFKVHRIKIDRSFVQDVDRSPERQALLAAILSMAQQLGLETLAEGVETPGEHSIAAQLGCGHVQGFGIARPMPFEEAEGWIRGHLAKLGPAPNFGRRAG